MGRDQFISSLRELNKLHNRTRRDFSETVGSLAQKRIDTLVSEGIPVSTAFPETWTVAKREYPDYTGVQDIPF